MNSTQRKFLIDRVTSKVTAKIKELSNSKLQSPSASNFIFKSILNNELELQDSAVILESLKKKALNAKEGSNWLSDERMGFDKESTIKLLIEDLVKLPNDYYEELKRVQDFNNNINKEIKVLYTQLETIEVRIQLASDKKLQLIINEVDDMGDISLMNTKLLQN